ncbi:hypothetical protein ABIA30_004036 [Mycobacterium sp. MAA66]|uniref:hypothetical protein n=1 Tax=Mycobacterium sp. MAA66 TaxID=3156297 RepID=UPI003518ECBA
MSHVDDGAERVCKLVGRLTIPIPWNLEIFIEHLASQRAKPIRLIPSSGLSTAGQPCGIWIGRSADDFIVYDDTTSSYHAEQIVLHEIGHMLLEHHGTDAHFDEHFSIQEFVPDIDPTTVSHIFGRTAYDTEQESQAELFASLIMANSRRPYRDSRFLSTFLQS